MAISEPMVQIIDRFGAVTPSEEAEQYLPLVEALDDETLAQFYRDMAIMRRFDTEATSLQRQGQMALWVPSLGQEGAQVGAGRATKPQDWVFPAYREHVIGRIRGVDLVEIVNMLRGNTHGGWDWKATHFHLYTLVIGCQSLHGTGFAMGRALDGRVGTGDSSVDEAVLTCFGDGATSEGDVSEALVFASSYNAPEVFLCQNNQLAISVPVSTQTRTTLAGRAAGFGIRSVRIDGNDVLASYAVTSSLLDEARAGRGPGFIEAVTYRMGPHTSSDDPTKYRTAEEVQYWKDRDPITRFRAYLESKGALSALFDEVASEAEDVAADLRARITTLPEPPIESMFEHVYSEHHPVMEAEAAWVADYEASLGGEHHV